MSLRLRLSIYRALAQVRPVNDYGAIGIGQLLNRLNTTASVMMIGAHPDDEDSALLAYLARGENARTAYLSLTRGDGGQNIIGPELLSRSASSVPRSCFRPASWMALSSISRGPTTTDFRKRSPRQS